MATAHQDGSSKGTTHWKKLTVQEMQGAMEAGGLKASLMQRFSNETLQRRSKPSENDPSRQPGLETRGLELGGKIHQTEHKEKSALLNIIGDGKYSVDRLREPEIQSVAVRALIDPQHGGLSGAVPSSDLGKKQRRAERFGLSVQLSEDEKRRARAARFGGSPADPLELNSLGEGLRKSEEQKKRKARAERFGLPVNSLLDEEEKRKARLVRFGMGIKYDSLEEEKREARAARFGLLSNNGTSEVN